LKKSLDGSLKASLLALAIASFPFGSQAAGLGGVKVFSGLGQPLRAEIAVSATAEELESLSARIGSPDAFRQAGVAYTPAAGSVQVNVDRRGSRPVLRLSSDRPLNEPFVDLVLEVDWAAGRLMRNFTFLLDPVDLVAPKPVAARVDVATASPRPAVAVVDRAAADTGRAGAHTVRRGDTLHRIATAHQYDGTSLDQMLVAIAAANRGAFDGGNINRLRAGSVLTIPAAEQVRAVDGNAARREVLVQAADFEAYRRQLAGVAAAQPTAVVPPAAQESAGLIVPRIEESKPVAESGDQLRVSGADGAGGAGNGDTVGRLQTLEEELVSREKSLEEANARLAQLEQSVRDLRALLELRSDTMGQLQHQASAAPAAAGAPRAEAGSVDQPQPAVSAPPTPPESAPGLFEDSRLLAGGGAALALLVGLLAYRARRRRADKGSRGAPFSEAPESRAVVGTAGGQSVDTGSSLIHTDFSQAGLSAIDTDEGVDPVAEADVYIAYGRDAQAEEILQDALKTDPGREAIYTKLLEIYAQRGSVKQFDLIAADLHARSGGRGGEWEKAAAMGRTIDPGNPLYRSHSGAQAASTAPATEVPSATEVVATLAAGFAATATFGGDRGGSEEEAVAREPQPATAAMPGAIAGRVDFDVDAPAGDEATLRSAGVDAGEAGKAARLPLSAEQSGSPPPTIRPLEFDFNLDLDDVGVADAGFEDTRVTATSAAAVADWSSAQAETALAFNLDLADSVSNVGAAVERETADIGVAAGGGRGVELSEAGGGVAPRPAGQSARALDLERSSFDSSLLDFNLDLDVQPSADAVAALDLTAISLPSTGSELEPEQTQPGGDWAQSGGGQSAPVGSEEVDTKLELARAYDEMGDRDGARELLEEVIREGSLAQQAAARQMIARFA
jgi:pilus assembly protein FimV